MATTTLSIVDAILKEVYESRIRDQLQSDTTLLTRIPQTSEGVTSDVGGKYVVFPIRTRRNHGMGARLEGEILPTPQSQRYSPARVALAYLYGGAELTGQTMELAESNEQAFTSALDSEMEGLREALQKDYNRQLYAPASGVMSTANAAGSTLTFVCANNEAIWLEIGMVIGVLDASAAFVDISPAAGSIITDIASTATTTTVTFTGATSAATASGDQIVRKNSQGKEMVGLTDIVANSGTLFNINPATDPVWKSFIDANAGTLRPISEGLMIGVVDGVRRKGGTVTVGMCNLGVRQQYFNLLSQQRRFNVSAAERDFEGGFRGLAFSTDKGDIPIVVDIDSPWHKLWFLNEKELKLYQERDWSFMNRDGSNWQRVVATDLTGAMGFKDAYQATMFKYCQFATHRRNSHGLLADIDHPVNNI